MRILELIRIDSIGGAEKVLLNGIPALHATGVDAVLGLLDPCIEKNNPILPFLKEGDIPYINFPDRGRISPLRILKFFSMLKREKFDVLHIHGYRAAIYGLPLARLLHIPIVITRHGLLSRNRKERIVEAFELTLTNVMNAAICVAPHLAKGIKTRAVIIPNAIPLPPASEFSLPSAPPQRCLFVGRLSQEKNPFLLLSLWEKIIQRFPLLQLDIVGDGPLLPSLQEKSIQKGLTKHVHFHGFANPAPFYHSADIFLLPSLREGLPLVALEAMAAQVPVIATSVGSLPQLLSQESSVGLLVPPNNLQKFYEALLLLLENPIITRSFGVKGRERILSQYSLKRWASQHKQLYQQLSTL